MKVNSVPVLQVTILSPLSSDWSIQFTCTNVPVCIGNCAVVVTPLQSGLMPVQPVGNTFIVLCIACCGRLYILQCAVLV